MARCFRTLAGQGDGSTVLSGSDVPMLSAGVVRGAFAALEAFRGVAFAPSPDGGFSLVGVPWDVPTAFLAGRIPWSTSSALAEAAAGAMGAGLAVRYLPLLPDVDEPGDLERLGELLRQGPDIAPATARALGELLPSSPGGRR